jgi:hypothetical protein
MRPVVGAAAVFRYRSKRDLAGLRIAEALALKPTDLDYGRGANRPVPPPAALTPPDRTMPD